jgi:hypothetical protein
MNQFALLVLCGLLSLSAFAQDRGQERRLPRHGFSDMQGKKYVNIGAQVCGVTEIRIYVRGDNVTIKDLDVLFGDDHTQDISLRRNFAPGQTSRWVRLNNAPRCIKGLFLEAEGDRDRNNATVTLHARIPTQYNYPVTISDPILVRDYNYSRRGRR